MSNIEQLLMDKKMKRTKARVLILKTLAKGLPLSAGEVFEAVRVKDTQLSLSTVYRNCEALAEHGLLSRSTTMSDGLTRYEFDHGTPSLMRSAPPAIASSRLISISKRAIKRSSHRSTTSLRPIRALRSTGSVRTAKRKGTRDWGLVARD